MDLNIRAIFGRFIVVADFHNPRGRPQVTGLKAETDMIAAYQTLHDFKASMNERVGSMEARTKELEQERTVLHGIWVQLDPAAHVPDPAAQKQDESPVPGQRSPRKQGREADQYEVASHMKRELFARRMDMDHRAKDFAAVEERCAWHGHKYSATAWRSYD